MKKVVFKRLLCFILSLIMLASVLSVNVSADIGDNTFTEVESNNTMSSADRIYNDYTVHGYCGGYDMDYFKIVLSSSSTITLTLVGDNSHLYIGIVDSTDKIIAAEKTAYVSSTKGYGTNLVKSVSDGTYYILLLNEENYYSNNYAFYVNYTATENNAPLEQSAYTWTNIGGLWYCIRPDGTYVTNAWVQDSQGWCYLDGNGRITYNQWIYDNVGWAYVGADGYMLTNRWIEDSQGWFIWVLTDIVSQTLGWQIHRVGVTLTAKVVWYITNGFKMVQVGAI